MKSKTLVVSVLFCFYVLLVSGVFQNCNVDHDPRVEENAFVGSEPCQSCHTEEFNEWQESHHFNAMSVATKETVKGNFNNTVFTSNGVESRFFIDDNKFYVNTEGPNGEYLDFEIKYTFGITPLQQYLVEFEKGRLQCLLIAWDTEKNEWFDLMPDEKLNTDDWLHWTKGSMTWNTMCADCHSTNLKKNLNPDSLSYATSWNEINVSCESCHGPGSHHVNYVQNGLHTSGREVIGPFLHQTYETSKKDQVEACARCHSRRGPITNEFSHSEDFMDHYIPSLPEAPLYNVDGQIEEEVYVYGSFLQSKMYHRSVSCTDCHNPHSNSLKFIGNDLCGQCHQKDKYDVFDHHFHAADTEGSQCVSCHMPGKTYMGNDFRRDHSFRVPRPDLSEKHGVPNACNGCHTDKDFSWAKDVIIEHYGPNHAKHYSDAFAAFQLGDRSALKDLTEIVSDTSYSHFIQATALDLSSRVDENSLPRLLNALKSEYDIMRYTAVNAFANYSKDDRLRYLSNMLKDSCRAVRTQAAYLLADISENLFKGSLEEAYKVAMEELKLKMDVQADFPEGQLYRAQYHLNRKERELAKKAYLKSYEIDPYNPASQIGLANLYYRQSNMKEAEKAFLKAIEINDASFDAHYSLGLLYAEIEDLNKAEKHLGKGARLSNEPRHYYNWGLTLQNLKRNKEAEQVYLSALEIDPESEANLYALSILYLQQGNKTNARKQLQKLLKSFPNNQEYLRLYGLSSN